MSGGVLFYLSLLGYVAFLVASVYFCVLADPDDSPLARFLTETIPRKAWLLLERCLGPKSLSVVGFFLDRLMMLFYCVVVFGSWAIIFSHVYKWLDEQDYVSPIHKYFGYAVFGLCFTSWRWAFKTSPGIITAKNIHRYDHFPYDDIMFVPGRVCPTRNIPRLARSKFDRYKYNENVPRFDHYCGWVHNTIGEENYRWFLLFLLVHVGMCAYGTYVIGHLYYGEILDKRLLEVTFFDRYSGEELKATKWIIFQYLFNARLMVSAVFAIMSVMTVALGLFLLYHAWMTSRGLTTNESYKWEQVKKWYKRELKRYEKAVQNGEIDPVTGRPLQSSSKKSSTSRPIVTDGDVTCTSGDGPDPVPTGDAKYDEEDEDPIAHPGPPPVNIYNRGLLENWKEVIFPLSLRKVKSKSKAT